MTAGKSRRRRARTAGGHKRRWSLSIAAVLTLCLVGWMFARSQVPSRNGRWRVLAGSSSSEVQVPLSVGGQWATQATAVVLQLDSELVIELGPQSKLRVLEMYDELGAGQTKLELIAGSLHVATSRTFAPRRLSVLAPQCEVEVVGTEFGIDIFPGLATCICCNEGQISVHSSSGPAHAIVAGEMAWCPLDGTMPMFAAAKKEHLLIEPQGYFLVNGCCSFCRNHGSLIFQFPLVGRSFRFNFFCIQ